jgi:1,5-anhydro-D-fructose reductase (1,5-anhydro-D-mannitol-forming)
VTVGWGIVSTAGIADESVAPALTELDGAELVGVTSRDLGRAQEFAAKHGARLATTNVDELFADPELQIVYIATPNSLHASQVIAAAAAGKHVFCDKPLATSVAEARAAVDACQEADVKLGINFQTRYYPPTAEILDVVRSGALGEILLVDCAMAPGRFPFRDWRTDRELAGLGTLNNLGVHAYDFVRYVLGAEIVEATALLDVGRRDELEKLAVSAVRFDNGTLANVLVSQDIPHYRADVSFYGTEGKIVGRSIIRPDRDATVTITIGDDERVTEARTSGGFLGVLAAFQRAVLEDTEPNPSGIDGLRSVELTDALERSAREGRTVELEAG